VSVFECCRIYLMTACRYWYWWSMCLHEM